MSKDATGLARKLGIREASRVVTIDAPNDLALGMPVAQDPSDGPWDVIVAFVHTVDALDEALSLRSTLAPSGGLWLAWPKKASKVPTELNREVVRAAGLSTGLVDNKVCSVDAVYSALRFVVRLADRRG